MTVFLDGYPTVEFVPTSMAQAGRASSSPMVATP
jgi:hypothetical protein